MHLALPFNVVEDVVWSSICDRTSCLSFVCLTCFLEAYATTPRP